MDNISYIRAGISCLPVIGPCMSLINSSQISNELDESDSNMNAWTRKSAPLLERLERLGRRVGILCDYEALCRDLRKATDVQKRLTLEGDIAAVRQEIPEIEQGAQVLLQNEREAHGEWQREWQVINSEGLRIKNRADLIPEKRNIYLLCGTVGSVLTVATVVALVALGILSSSGGIACLAIFSVVVGVLGVTVIGRVSSSNFTDVQFRCRFELAHHQQRFVSRDIETWAVGNNTGL